MTWRSIAALFHLLPAAPSTVRAWEEQHMARKAIQDLQSTAVEAQSTMLDLIDRQELSPRRHGMIKDTATLRQTLAAVAERAGRTDK